MEGALFDTPVGSVLETLSRNRKSGRLVVDGGRSLSKVTAHYNEGQIIRIDVDRRDPRLLLGYMLSQTGAISRDELKLGLKAHKKDLRRLGDVLVASGNIDAADVQAMVDLQAREALYPLFEWKEGRFKFDPLQTPAEGNITPIKGDDVLLEGYKRLDEWPLIRARVNNYRVVFRAVQSVSRNERSQSDDLTSSEARVLGLVDASRNVNELVDRCGIGEFETCKAIASLLTRGYIKAVSVKGVVKDPRGHQHDGGFKLAGRIAWNVMLAGLVVAGIWLQPGDFKKWRDEATVLANTDDLRLKRHVLHRVRASAALYRASQGRYPKSLTILSNSEFGRAMKPLEDALKHLEYVSIGTDFSLRWKDEVPNG